jgi:AcrR family transcriptional regulator
MALSRDGRMDVAIRLALLLQSIRLCYSETNHRFRVHFASQLKTMASSSQARRPAKTAGRTHKRLPEADASDGRTGRPRDQASRRAILSATMSLLQTVSVADLAIETVAREARVSKATIYRWWTSKGALVIEAFLDSHFSNTPMPTAMDPQSAIKRHISSLAKYFSGRAGTLVVQILCEGRDDRELFDEFNRRFTENRRRLVQETIERGQKEGQFRTDLEASWIVELLYAPIYRRLIFAKPLDAEFISQLCDTVDRLIAKTSTQRAPRNVAKE